MSETSATVSIKQLSGFWRSEYTYKSSDHHEERKSIQYVRLLPKDHGFVMETVKKVNEAYMLARFSLDGSVATCSWQQSTSPKGDYKGTLYHGAGQLIISDDAKHMSGKWVGFGKNMEVKTGPWEFTYLGDDASVIDKLDIATGQ